MSKNSEFSYETVYEPHIFPDPLLPFIFHKDTVRRGERYCFPNWHNNTEILHVTMGRGSVCLDTVEHSVTEGDIVVINSNVLHSTYGTTDRFVYDCLIVDHGFCKACGIDTERLLFEAVIRDEVLSEGLNAVRNSYDSPSPCRAARIRRAVLDVLIRLREVHTAQAEHAENGLERVKAAMLYMRQNLEKPLSLDGIAAEVGISKYYFSREFKRVTGQTPVEYLNKARCREAGQMIRDGSSVSEAALRCGFENLSYFTRTYKKYIGELPSRTGRGSRTAILSDKT